MLHQYPALCPHEMDQGFPFHDAYEWVSHDVIVRRITLHTTGAVFSLRPSCVMPSMIGRTDAVEKARSLRQWGGRLLPWRMSSAAMPCAGIGPGGLWSPVACWHHDQGAADVAPRSGGR